jgi:deoxyribose-phosphate aldolase
VGIESIERQAPGRWPFEAADVATSDAGLRQVLHGLPGIDQVGAGERAAALATRSIKKDAKLTALDLAISMVDLTTLEGADTPGKVRAMCAKARHPDAQHPDPGTAAGGGASAAPPVAAVCVYPDLVAVAKQAVAGSTVAVASVATAFPSGRASLSVKLADVRDAVSAGADEIDMVIDRGAFLAGHYGQVYAEIRAVREACGPAHLKVILETGELATLDNVARASWLAMMAGADFIKTSTGKVTPASTPPVALVMLAAVRDFEQTSGRRVGVKVAGGIRTAKDAIRYLVLVNEVAGPTWLTPALFRIGASTLLNDLLMQRWKQHTGRYAGADYFTID